MEQEEALIAGVWQTGMWQPSVRESSNSNKWVWRALAVTCSAVHVLMAVGWEDRISFWFSVFDAAHDEVWLTNRRLTLDSFA